MLLGKGASPDGASPLVDRFDLQSKRATCLFHWQELTYSATLALLDAQGTRLLLSRESSEEPAHYFYARWLVMKQWCMSRSSNSFGLVFDDFALEEGGRFR